MFCRPCLSFKDDDPERRYFIEFCLSTQPKGIVFDLLDVEPSLRRRNGIDSRCLGVEGRSRFACGSKIRGERPFEQIKCLWISEMSFERLVAWIIVELLEPYVGSPP